MPRMTLKQFRRIVSHVMDTLPEQIRRHLENVVIDIEEEPDEDLLRSAGFSEEEIAQGASLYGLFIPFDTRAPDSIDFLDRPNRILIFKRPLEEDFPDPRQLRIEIRKTVVHEVAHHFGWTDRDLERFDNTPDPFEDES